MSRVLRLMFCLFAGVIFSALSFTSHAETMAATSGSSVAKTSYRFTAGGNAVGNYYATPTQAGEAAKSTAIYSDGNITGAAQRAGCTGAPLAGTGLGAMVTRSSDNANFCWPMSGPSGSLAVSSAFTICPTGTTESGGLCHTYTCPSGQGWSLSGATCSRPDCVAPQVRDAADGVCKAPCGADQYRDSNGQCLCNNGSQTGTNGTCCPAPGAGGGAPMQWCYVDSPSASSCASAGQNGCAIRCNNVTYQAGTGDQVNIFPKQALGQACGYTGIRTPADSPGGGEMTGEQLQEVAEATKDPEKAKTPEGCLASGSGYVTSNGVTTCVSGGEGGEVKKTETGKVTDTVKNPTTGENETTTTETAKSETTNGDGTKTGTTTETVTNPNGTKTITTTTKTQNPDGTVTESVKKETVAVDGTKTTTGDKTGTEAAGTWCQKNPNDPICKKETDECELFPDRASCFKAGTPEEGSDLLTKAVGLDALSPVTVASNATCPADIPLSHGVTFSFQHFCMYAEGIRPVILALAWLAAGFFIFGFKDS